MFYLLFGTHVIFLAIYSPNQTNFLDLTVSIVVLEAATINISYIIVANPYQVAGY